MNRQDTSTQHSQPDYPVPTGRHRRASAIALLALLTLSASPALATATITTQVPDFISPGVEYQLVIEGNNTGLGGERTDAVQWQLHNAFYDDGSWEYVPGVSVSLGGPTSNGMPANENDFFQDIPMDINWIFLPSHLSARLVQAQGTGPANKTGDAAIYDFNINGYDAEWGRTGHFVIDAVVFLSPSGAGQSVTSIFQTFTTTPRGDLNHDVFVSPIDLDYILSDWGHTDTAIIYPRADVNGDGVVDPADLDYILADWGEGSLPMSGEGQSIPEPSTLTLLVFGMIAASLKRTRRCFYDTTR